ncbi:J domain-containing protein [Actimicrobium sp. CCI2.3]|uniref:J domain-containing protein n=1 Tax=Actimicrobium sp. CCI2.3 TaxID=3048616 RepID=UPI000A03FB50
MLSVSRSASLDEVKTAYRSLIRQYHPDKVATLGQELRELAERKSKVINQAYSDALLAVGNRK